MARSPRFPPLPHEARLVFLSAGTGHGGGRERMGRLLTESLNWQLVVLLAEREKAVARLHRLLSRDHASAVPPEVLAHLARVAQVESFRAMVLEQRLDQLLNAFEAAGIPVLLLKGAAMARTVYPSFSDRPMGDLDLLVPPDRTRESRAVAEGVGWRVAAGISEENFPAEEHHHLPPMTDGTALNLGLDLHTRLSGTWEPEGLGPQDLWARAPLLPGATLVQVPDPADLLLHVCHHFAWSHCMGFGGWKAFRDVAVLVDHPGLDIPDFQSRVARTRTEPMVRWTLHMAERLGQVTIPSALEELASVRGLGTPGFAVGALTRHFAAVLCGLDASIPVYWHRRLWELGVRPDRMAVGGKRPWSHDEAFRGVAPLRLRSRGARVEGAPGEVAAGDRVPDPSRSGPASSGTSRLQSVARHAGWVLGASR